MNVWNWAIRASFEPPLTSLFWDKWSSLYFFDDHSIIVCVFLHNQNWPTFDPLHEIIFRPMWIISKTINIEHGQQKFIAFFVTKTSPPSLLPYLTELRDHEKLWLRLDPSNLLGRRPNFFGFFLPCILYLVTWFKVHWGGKFCMIKQTLSFLGVV